MNRLRTIISNISNLINNISRLKGYNSYPDYKKSVAEIEDLKLYLEDSSYKDV